MKLLTHPQSHASEILIVQMHILQTNLFEKEVFKQAIKDSIITAQQQTQTQQQNNQNLTLVWAY